ncbi:MAG: hypothetical protein NZ902_02735 [Acidilobaceae archaeon]|nr:hypothetical protein [Acidilobaceae archaeon]MCX8165736.1 hypothetical protein [Acidilobaceae archaeon]MDW7974161.1 hypothetical protein [Sulfolobales archaeon]
MSGIRRDAEEISARFGIDLHNGLSKVVEKLNQEVVRGALARYHALLQLLVAVDLHKKGFDVSVEEDLPTGFRADVHAEGPCCSVIAEIETGYVPQEWILRLEEYLAYRAAYKAAAYSADSDVFLLAMPSHTRAILPEPLLKPIEERSREEIALIKAMIAVYNKGQLQRIGWRAHLARIDAIAYVNIEDNEIEYVILNNKNPKLEVLA